MPCGMKYPTPCTNILPTVIPVFDFDYKEYNKTRETKGHSHFICDEYIKAKVLTCLKSSD